MEGVFHKSILMDDVRQASNSIEGIYLQKSSQNLFTAQQTELLNLLNIPQSLLRVKKLQFRNYNRFWKEEHSM